MGAKELSIEMENVVADEGRITPIDRDGAKRLMDSRLKMREMSGVSGSAVTNRDILEYSHIRNMGYGLQIAADAVLDMWSEGGYFRMAAEVLVKEKLGKARSEGFLSQRQVMALEQAQDRFLDDVDHFNEWLSVHDDADIKNGLGSVFAGISEDLYRINSKKFPGVVIVEIQDKETYKQLTGRETLGQYAPTFGEGELRGRVLFVNQERVAESGQTRTDLHEYYHFLFFGLVGDLEILPEVSSRLKREFRTSKLEAKEGREKRLDTLLKGERQVKEAGLLEIEEEKEKPGYGFVEQTEFGTYPEGPIKTAFDQFRTEFLSWSVSGKFSSDMKKYFGNKLDGAKSDVYWGTFRLETVMVKGLLEEAVKRGVKPQEIDYLVAGSRNMQQVAKNIYFHLQAKTWL